MSLWCLWQSRAMKSASCPRAMCQRTARLQHFCKDLTHCPGKITALCKFKAEAFRSWQPGMGNSKNNLSDHCNLRGKRWVLFSSKLFCGRNVTELLWLLWGQSLFPLDNGRELFVTSDQSSHLISASLENHHFHTSKSRVFWKLNFSPILFFFFQLIFRLFYYFIFSIQNVLKVF